MVGVGRVEASGQVPDMLELEGPAVREVLPVVSDVCEYLRYYLLLAANVVSVLRHVVPVSALVDTYSL